MAFQGWVSLQFMKLTEHGLPEDMVPSSVPRDSSFAWSPVYSSGVSTTLQAPAGSWSSGDGSGTTLPLKSFLVGKMGERELQPRCDLLIQWYYMASGSIAERP